MASTSTSTKRSKYEQKLDFFFKNETKLESVISTWKCTLILKLHHAGRLYLTGEKLYFTSTKNLYDPLPNPLTASSLLTDLKSIQALGLNGLSITKKNGEVAHFDGFEEREAVYTKILSARAAALGKDVPKNLSLKSSQSGDQPPIDLTNFKFEPLNQDMNTLWQRDIASLPFFENLSSLASNWCVFDASGKCVFSGPNSPLKMSQQNERLKQLLSALLTSADGVNDLSDFEKDFNAHFGQGELTLDQYKALIAQGDRPPSVAQFLSKPPYKDSVMLRALRAGIHPVTGAVERIKVALNFLYTTKDKSWHVDVHLDEKEPRVIHSRVEVNEQGHFEVVWELHLCFDSIKFSSIQTSHVVVRDLRFSKETSEKHRYKIQQLLKEFLPIAGKSPTKPNAAYFGQSAQLSCATSSSSDSAASSSNATATTLQSVDSTGFNPEKSVLLASFVDCSDQQLSEIPKSLSALKDTLQTLYVHGNALTSLPEDIDQFKHLQVLYVNGNKITKLPAALFKLTDLRELHFGMNPLTEIPAEIGNLTNLRTLSLSYLDIEKLPDSICALTNLKNLHIHNNKKLTALPFDLPKLTALKTLEIHNTALPKSLIGAVAYNPTEIFEKLKEMAKK